MIHTKLQHLSYINIYQVRVTTLFYSHRFEGRLSFNPTTSFTFVIFGVSKGEKEIGKVRQAVLESLLGKTKYNTPTSTQTRPETESSLNMGHSREHPENLMQVGKKLNFFFNTFAAAKFNRWQTMVKF